MRIDDGHLLPSLKKFNNAMKFFYPNVNIIDILLKFYDVFYMMDNEVKRILE